MTPRNEISWIDLDAGPDAVRQQLLDTPHSLFPVCRGSLDQVLGVAVARLAAGGERANRIAELHELPHRQEGVALLERAQQAHAQALGGERLEDVVVGDELAWPSWPSPRSYSDRMRS